MKVTGALALLRALEHEGVEVIFGIPGGASMPIYDPLVDSSSIRHILCRHEQGAGHAAEGYAWATGRVGVCMATSGPGGTNLVTPIADAKMDSVPIVAITGQVTVQTADSSTRAVVDRYLSSEVVYMGGGFGLDEDQSGDVLQLRRRDWTPWEFERACRNLAHRLQATVRRVETGPVEDREAAAR